MLTFKEWLAEYTQKNGTPPAAKMAEDAWNYIKEHAWLNGYEVACQESDLLE